MVTATAETSLAKKTIHSLPVEVIARILGFCDRFELHHNQIYTVCSLFGHASRLIPRIPVKEIFRRLYYGDWECLRQMYFTDVVSQASTMDVVLASGIFQYFCLRHPSEKILCGRYALVLAVCSDLTNHLCLPYDDFEADRVFVASRISSDPPENEFFQYAIPEVMRLFTREMDTMDELAFALKNFNRDCIEDFLADICTTLVDEPPATSFALRKILDENGRRVLEFLCLSENLDYVNKFCREETLTIPILDALYNGDLNMDLWYHQLFCWLFVTVTDLGVKRLLQDPRVDPTRWNYLPLELCMLNNAPPTVLEMIKDPRIDPGRFGNWMLDYAIQFEGVPLARYLLQCPGIDPTNQRTVHSAMEYQPEIFKVLLSDPRLDSGAYHNELVKQCARGGYDESLILLMDHTRADVSADENDAFKQAASSGHLHILKLLVKDPKVDLSVGGNEALVLAVLGDFSDIVEWLLKQRGVDPSLNDNEVLIDIVSSSELEPALNMDSLRVLLQDPRVEASARDNEAFRVCFNSVYRDVDFDDIEAFPDYYQQPGVSIAHVKIGKMLLEDENVQSKLREMYPKRKGYGLRGSLFDEQKVYH